MGHATAVPEKHHDVTQITVTVSYAGLSKHFSVNPHQSVQSLLEQALNAFGINSNRHAQSLYTEGGAELPDAQSLEVAGVKNGVHLLLRPSQVKGGAIIMPEIG